MNNNNLVNKVMELPAIVPMALMLSVPVLMIMNHSAVMMFFLLIPLCVQNLKYERVSEGLIALPLIFVFGLFGILMYIATFSKTIRGIFSLKTYGFLFSITALLFGFLGQSFGTAVFKFNWYTLPEKRFSIFLVSIFLYVVLNLFAKHSITSTTEDNNESKTNEEPKVETKEETKKETEVKKEKEPKQEQIDPNNASFANVIRFETYIRKDRQDS